MLGLKPVADPARRLRLLRSGRARRAASNRPVGVRARRRAARPEVADFKLAEERWDSAVAARRAASVGPGSRGARRAVVPGGVRGTPRVLPRRSGRALDAAGGGAVRRERPPGSDGLPHPGRQRSPRHRDGEASARRVLLDTIVRRVVQHDDGVHASTIEDSAGRRTEIAAPTTSCARCRRHGARGAVRTVAARAAARRRCAPALRLRDAAAAAVRAALLAQARTAERVRHGLATGAIWDGNEQQRGPRAFSASWPAAARRARCRTS